VSCEKSQSPTDTNNLASDHTKKSNQAISKFLNLDADFAQQADYLDATKGLIAQEEQVLITNEDGEIVWNNKQYEFIEGQTPDTVNQSFWRKDKRKNLQG